MNNVSDKKELGQRGDSTVLVSSSKGNAGRERTGYTCGVKGNAIKSK